MKITDINGSVKLNNGLNIPYLGLGVYKIKDGEEVFNAVQYALDAGYRYIDTASAYFNEKGVGRAINEHRIPREEIFVSTKVWNSEQGYDNTIKSFNKSLDRLNMEYIDLYLQHWPVKGKFKETWKAMETLYEEGKIKAIGVCNFLQFQLEDLMSFSKIKPTINQVEFHPYLTQESLQKFCKKENIQIQSWFPLMHGEAFKIEGFQELATKYHRSVSQLLLRWNLQKDIIIIPKSKSKTHIIENSELFDFEISREDMSFLDSFDSNLRMGPNPANFNF
ncbi:aldo/keto reductase [Cellulophaga baltica]|uniref:aldo/keto reductase n=1 Tax=Cellulophaga baltica TaxID=76594 RepID=UPI0021491B92|nr:aldo/keto reductase [Cellulophaga baltica]MCR1026718.1 aldo/keto reductase [Cellulophaga baltica]